MRTIGASVVALLTAGSVAVAGFWGTEALVDSGAVAAFDATADSAGVIWVATAYPDNAVGLYRSDDFGSTWRGHWAMQVDSAVRQLQLLAGQGDSAFLYLFILQDGNGGDLWLARIRMDSAVSALAPVAVGPDTIDDFSAALDRDNRYYLYCLYANEHRTGRTGAFTRSVDYGASWESGTDWWNAWDPCVSYTTGSTIHCAWRYALTGGEIHYSFNRHYGMSGYWSTYRVVSGNADQCLDPAVIQADSSPESQAAVWVFYTAGRRDSVVRDLQYSASPDGGASWTPGPALGEPFRDEQQSCLAADLSGPNDYVSLCYSSGSRLLGDTVSALWTCANSRAPVGWLEPVKVSRFPLAELAPKLVYVPRAPMRLPAVFYSQQGQTGPWGVRFAAPWLAGDSGDADTSVPATWPNPSIGPVRVSAKVAQSGSYKLSVYDAAGRLVANLFRGILEPGPQFWIWDRKSTTGASVPAGTFFVRLQGPGVFSCRRLTLLER
jgi:hypothetical protein